MASEGLPRYRGAWLALGWITALGIAVGSLVPSVPQVASGTPDKLLHFLAYAGLAFLFAGTVSREHWGRVVVGLLLLGGTIELAQEYLTESRAGEWGDMAANALGIGAGLFVAAVLPGNWCRQLEAVAGVGGTAE
jgi:VanZ family protein